jgi:hypothetical protein
VKFSLDDFGTGYSSLTYFHKLPIAVLKIDRSFVCAMMTNQHDQDIVEGVLSLSTALKRPVVAEGVESIEIGIMLLQLGCSYAQGFGIARPMPPETLLDWSSKWAKDDLWQNLSERTQGPTPFYDLNVAFFTHQRWMERLIQHLESGSVAPPPMNWASCQFTHWYRGIGSSRYGMREQFPFLDAKHRAVHELGLELLSQAEHQGRETALARLGELQTCSNELIDLLGRLAEH